MIDPDTINEFEDFDGHTLWAYGFDTVDQKWKWTDVPIEELIDAGRTDILQRLGLIE